MDAKEMRRRLHAAARGLGIYPDAEAEYDPADRRWEWTWTDGPPLAQVAAELARQLGQEAAGRVRLRRRLSPRAAALSAVLQALGRGQDGRGDPHAAPPDPGASPDARTGALADVLAAAAPAYAVDDPHALARQLRESGGPAALLHPYTGTAADTRGDDEGDDGDPLMMTPIEHLTARYAARSGWETAAAWRERLEVLDARTAATTALADDDADRATRLAAVALLGDLRRELETLELAAMDAAADAGASYADLGRALGVSRQVAHKRHIARAADRPARLQPQG